MKAVFNWRYYVLLATVCVACTGILGVPDESLCKAGWMACLFVSKGTGALAAYAFYRLVSYWDARGSIPEWTKFYQGIEEEQP